MRDDPRSRSPSTRRRTDTALIARNLALVVLVLLPAYVVIAAALETLLGSSGPGGTGARGFIDSARLHAQDRWWVPLLYLFVAPFVSALLVWTAQRWPRSPLRIIALVAAPAGYLALVLFLFARSASSAAPLVRAVLPGVLAAAVYAAVIGLPRTARTSGGTPKRMHRDELVR